MAFRPLPLLTLASIPALALLIALGVWQLARADEKRALIADYEAAAARDAHPDLMAPFCFIRASAYGQRAVTPARLEGQELRFFGARTGDGAPGWGLLRLTPAPDCSCGEDSGEVCDSDLLLIVEAGFETLAGERSGPPEIVEVRLPPRPNAFTADNSPERAEFYRFDREALALAFGVPAERIDAEYWLAPAPRGLPPGLAAMPPSRHVGYALTWFGLALALVGVYLVFHHRAGRL